MTTTTPTGYCTYYLSPIKVLTVFLPSPQIFVIHSIHQKETGTERDTRQNRLGMNSQSMCNLAFLMIA